MKTDFSSAIFNECRPVLEDQMAGPVDGSPSTILSRYEHVDNKEEKGFLFFAAIVRDSIIGPFRVEDGVKFDSKGYFALLNKHFRPWWKKQPLKLRKTLMYMHDNTPSHASRYTIGLNPRQKLHWPVVCVVCACASESFGIKYGR